MSQLIYRYTQRKQEAAIEPADHRVFHCIHKIRAAVSIKAKIPLRPINHNPARLPSKNILAVSPEKVMNMAMFAIPIITI